MESMSVWHWLILLFFGLPLILKFGFGVGAKRVKLKNPTTGQMIDGFFGYSWTYLLFGFWVPLFRGEIGIALLHFVFTFVTGGLWQPIMSFLYNRQYTNRRIMEGFKLSDSSTNNGLAATRLGLDLTVHLQAG